MACFDAWDIGACGCIPPCTLSLFPLCMTITDYNIPGSPAINVTRPNTSSNWTGTYNYSYPGGAGCGFCSTAATVVLTYTIYLSCSVLTYPLSTGCLEVKYGYGSSGCPTGGTISGHFSTGSFTTQSWGCTPDYYFFWGATEGVGSHHDNGAAKELYCSTGPFTWSAAPC